jgi:multidrug resistance efflux pump
MVHSRFNWFYALIILLFGAMLYISAKFFKGSASSSIGIATAKEYKISSEKSAVVKAVHVQAGQQVKAGDLLMELTSAELDIEIDKLSNKISVMKAEQVAKSKMVESEIAFIRAEEGVTDEELVSEIEQTKSEIDLNRSLTRTFAKDSSENSETSPLDVKVKSLKTQQRKHQMATDIRVEDIEKKNALEQSQLINQIRLAERELELMKDEQRKLSKFAVSDGVIGNIFVKDGEQVSSYTPLLSVTPLRPTTVVAYLVGPKTNEYSVGAAVTVKAYGSPSAQAVPGKVIGYGSVSELPEILQKSTAVKAFGREVFIEIVPENDFANGQKVLIR